MSKEISGMRRAQLRELTEVNKGEIPGRMEIIFSDVESGSSYRGVEIIKIGSVLMNTRNTLCFCGSGKKQKKCHPDINPDSLIAHQYRIMHLIDKEIQSCPYTICKLGCNECCTDDFKITVSEFFTILNYLKISCTNEQIDKIISLAKYKIATINRDESSGEITISKCLFIKDTDGSCDIYEVRPIICRKYGYYTNAHCDKISSNEQAAKALMNNSSVDTVNERLIFTVNGKNVTQPLKTIAYWFSRLDENHQFSSARMNNLFRASTDAKMSEYLRILLF